MSVDPMLGAVLTTALTVSAGLTLLAAYRVMKGPTVADRIVALDVIGTNVVAIAVLYGLQTGQHVYILVALMLAIIGFISTTAVSMYVNEGDIIR